MDLRATDNPYRFYGLVASGCLGDGIYMSGTQSEEFHGVSVFGNTIDVSLTGTKSAATAYVLFDGAQINNADQENMYLDQQNETLLCAANCVFTKAAQNCTASAGSDCGAAIVIGPDARTKATGNSPVIAQFNQGVFDGSAVTDIQFDHNANGNSCKCTVALGGGMYDVSTQGSSNPGAPTTNNPALLAGQTHYAPPVFANAASVGVPLTLAPSEFGMGVTTGTTQAGAGGLKLSVQCHGVHIGTVDIRCSGWDEHYTGCAEQLADWSKCGAMQLKQYLARGAGFLSVAMLVTAQAAAAKIIKFDPPSSVQTEPQSVNAKGWITGVYYKANTENGHGFVRALDGTITTFDVTGADCGTYPFAITRKGWITGVINDQSCKGGHGFLRAPDGTTMTIDVPKAASTGASSINDYGAITGDYDDSEGFLHGYLRTPTGKFQKFDPPNSTLTAPQAINDTGDITGSYSASGTHGFLRTSDGTITTFDPTGSEETDANGMNDSDAIVGEYYTGTTFIGYLRNPDGTFTTINPNGSTSTFLFGIDDKGYIVGDYFTDMGHGFVRSPDGKITTFDPKESSATNPSALANSGTVTGWFADADYRVHGFVRTP